MTSSIDGSRSRVGLTDWVGLRHQRLVLPSWLLSALIHATTLAMLIWLSQSRGCRPDYAGDGGESFRTVGLYLTTGETDDESQEEPNEESNPIPADPLTAFEPTTLLDGPPIELARPTDLAEPVIGLGGPPELTGGSSPVLSLETTPLIGPPPSARNVLGKSTSLFGIQDAGRKFVYAMDRSGSMSEFGAMRSAKAELMASIENFDVTQQFQVIFYNNTPLPLVPTNARSEMFRGIELHRLDVERQIGSIVPEGGTDHLDALRAALKYNADVIFFLTDGAQPGLTKAQLEAIRRRNNGGARIHCIEFGEGPSLYQEGGPRNFMQKLAEQNGGQYQYRDVKRLR